MNPPSPKDGRHLERGHRRAAIRFAQLAPGQDTRATLLPPILHQHQPAAATNECSPRQRTMQREPLFRVQHVGPIKAEARVREPGPGIGENACERGEYLKAGFVHETQVRAISGLLADAQRQRVEHCVSFVVVLDHVLDTPVQQLRGI
ncbi:hypothetical protein LJR029_001260 [Caballeronia sp. LjRoot29]